jgi:hypothetical protein
VAWQLELYYEIHIVLQNIFCCFVPSLALKHKNDPVDGFFVFFCLVVWKQGCQMAYFKTKNPNLGKL